MIKSLRCSLVALCAFFCLSYPVVSFGTSYVSEQFYPNYKIQ